MGDAITTASSLLQPIASLATLGLAFKLARQSKRYSDAVETIERVALLVEGDPKEHEDNAKRYGLLGRTIILEGVTPRVAKLVRAVLRGMGVSTDISDRSMHKLESDVKKRFRSFNRLEALDELVRPDPDTDENEGSE